MTSFDPTAEYAAIREGVANVCAAFPGPYWRDLDARRAKLKSNSQAAIAQSSNNSAALIGGSLLNMAVFGAMISYAFQGLSFIVLRARMPGLARPYKSPLGVPGAVISVLIALWTMYYQLQDAAYVRGVYAALIWYAAGLAYFALIGRHRLILSPEEQFALNATHKPR